MRNKLIYFINKTKNILKYILTLILKYILTLIYEYINI